MGNFLSGRQTKLKVGISSFSENNTVLEVIGNTSVTGVVSATNGFVGNLIGDLTGNSDTTTALETARIIELTGDIGGQVLFDGTSNVSIAATIQPNSVALGSDTTGDYVESISGTSNQITVTDGTGEGSTPILSIPSQFTVPQDITVTRDLQVNRNLNVTGNITVGGTSATLFTTEFKVYDPDIVLGFRTDGSNNDISTDNTANHGGIAIASTEGTPLIQLYDVGVGETNPATYKKFMWFKSGTFTGLNTDAWISNYAIGIGSTQVPSSVILAAGSVQFTENDLKTVRNINSSGVVTATGGFNLGISSAGTPITSGPITQLNFIGAGNTFAINGTTVDISIAGGGGAVSISSEAPENPSEGNLWYSTILGRTFIYYEDEDSSQWVDSSPFNIPEPELPSTPGKTSGSFIATEGQTIFNYSYKVGYIDVFLNGIRLNSSEFIASNGTSITLLTGASADDVLDVVEYTMGIGDTGPQGLAGPLSGVTSTTSNSTYYPLIVSGVGSVSPFINDSFNFNPSTGTLSATAFVGDGSGLTGTGSTVADDTTTNETFYPVFTQITTGTITSSKVSTTKLSFNPSTGNLSATDFNSTSDINLKDNIKTIENPIEKVLQINGITFNWKESQQPSAGIIAQDVEKVLPEIVRENDNTKSLNYNGLIGLLVEVVKEQQEQINNLRDRIEKLEG